MMKHANKPMALSFFAIVLCLVVHSSYAQVYTENRQQLEKYASDELYEPACVHDVSGKWYGTEIQYDETGTFIKVKFDIEFHFEQDGNRITGTSYIKDKLHNDVGYMNIRGYVLGDKLHFEEYELTSQHWETPNRVWCFRTGALDLTKLDSRMQLSGDYDAYAAYDYRPCRDYCHSVLFKDVNARPGTEDLSVRPDRDENNLIQVAPSPFTDRTTITYVLERPAKVRLEVFDLSGRKVAELAQGSQAAGKFSHVFEADRNPAGSYLVRLFVDDELFTKQIVRMR